MKTQLRCVHEESFKLSDGEYKILGILICFSIDKNMDIPFNESFPYIYKNGMYIFFHTIIDMMDYLLYGEKNMNRSYMEEVNFDKYYDAPFLNGKFSDVLEWTTS